MSLCKKSFEIYDKKVKKQQDIDQQAEEDQEVEKGVIYDNEEEGEGDIVLDEFEGDTEDEWDIEDEDDEFENELYETKLDKIDEILFFRDQIINLQNANQA